MLKHKTPYRITYLPIRWLAITKNKKENRKMYLGQLLAYPIWLYIGLSVIVIVRNAWKNMEE